MNFVFFNDMFNEEVVCLLHISELVTFVTKLNAWLESETYNNLFDIGVICELSTILLLRL